VYYPQWVFVDLKSMVSCYIFKAKLAGQVA